MFENTNKSSLAYTVETTNLMPQSSASINTAEMLICKGIIFYLFNSLIKNFSHALMQSLPHLLILSYTQARTHAGTHNGVLWRVFLSPHDCIVA